MDNEKNLSIEIKQDVAKGTYSNLSIITHSKSEFVIDFVSRLPGMPKAQVTDRIIMTPENAKTLLMALQDNLHKYEQTFGTIVPKGHNNPAGNPPFMPMGGQA